MNLPTKPWGISIEFDDRGLECAAWMTVDVQQNYGEPMTFHTEEAADTFIRGIPDAWPCGETVDRILTARRFT